MKQNEKFLVYAVTGILVVILMLAVVLGGRDARHPNEGSKAELAAAPSLEDLLPRKLSTGSGTLDPAAKPADAPQPQAVDAPLAANVVLQPPTAASQVTEKLGLSRRDREFRVVRVQTRDTFDGLVQKWCGKTDGYADMARAYNEELDERRMRVGSELFLPWVDDEVILAAWDARNPPKPATTVPVGVPMPPATGAPATVGAAVPGGAAGAAVDPLALSRPGPASGLPRPVAAPAVGTAGGATAEASSVKAGGGAASGRKYAIKAGDSLWAIAAREAGKKNAASYLEKLREANPGLDAERLRQGQEIVLPPAPAATADAKPAR